jgi:hypothetical protein
MNLYKLKFDVPYDDKDEEYEIEAENDAEALTECEKYFAMHHRVLNKRLFIIGTQIK